MMTGLCSVEEAIVTELENNEAVHKTFIRRSLDYQFDARITYPVVDAFLTRLCEAGYVTTGERGEYYELAT